jgi:hypothetical protein
MRWFCIAGIIVFQTSAFLMKYLKMFIRLGICSFFLFLSFYMIAVALPVLKEDHKKNSLQPLSTEVKLVVDDLLAQKGYKNREDLLNKGRIGAVIFISFGIFGVAVFGHTAYRVFFLKKKSSSLSTIEYITI